MLYGTDWLASVELEKLIIEEHEGSECFHLEVAGVILSGVRPAALFVDGEVAVVHLLCAVVEVDLAEQALVVRVLGETFVFFLEDGRVHAFHWIAVSVVLAITLDRIDEKERQHLDAHGAKALFLVQVLLDRAADHFALNRQRFHAAMDLTNAQVLLATWVAQLNELLAFGCVDFANAKAAVLF